MMTRGAMPPASEDLVPRRECGDASCLVLRKREGVASALLLDAPAKVVP